MAPQSQQPKDGQPKPYPPQVRKSVESGLITYSAVSENRRPDTSVTESINMHFDTIGAATLRKGMTFLGTGMPAGNILGMHYFVDTVSPNTNTKLVAVGGTALYYLSAGTWTSKRTGLTAGSKARFSTFLNFMFMVNGTEATAIWDGTGSAFATTGNAASAPTGTLIENFRSRMWIGGNTSKPSRIYFSSVPSSAATPVITWDTSDTSGQWIDISPSDGDFLTALQRSRNVMLAFKTNRLYRVFDINQIDPDPYYNVGTSSQESVLESKTGTFFHHSTGFYQYNVYGNVEEISRPIIDIVRAIPASNYTSIVGWAHPDGDHLMWCVGDVTYKGVAYTNMVVRYSISTQAWTHYSYPRSFTMAIRRQPFYTDGTTQFALTGDTAGNISEMDTGLDDAGTPISYSLVHRWDNVDGLLSTRKVIQGGAFLHYGGGGTKIAYQTDDDDPDSLNDWSKKPDKGMLASNNTIFNTMNIKARKFRFRLFGTGGGTGASTGFQQPFQYNGYELIEVRSEFVQNLN